MGRIKLSERTLDNDIKYGGILSYRHLRIIAWICLAIAQISVVLALEAKLNPDTAGTVSIISTVLGYIGSLPLPLFFLANVSVMTRRKSNFRSLFYFYGGLAIGMFLLQNFIIMHYVYGVMKALDPTTKMTEAFMFVGTLMPYLGNKAYMLNIFIDMFLCTLLFYFIYYEPKKYFQGKKIVIFRLLVLIPIAYEVGAIFLKYYLTLGYFVMPSYYYALLPSKPPLVFLAFVALIIFLKIGEVRYKKKHNNDINKWYEYSQTKAHSFKVSLTTAFTFLFFAIADLVVIGIYLVVIVMNAPAAIASEEEFVLYLYTKLMALLNSGIGGAVPLLLIIPIALLFSYTKVHKNPKLDTIIPPLGIALMVAVLVEGFFLVITKNLEMIMTKIMETDEEARFLNCYYEPKLFLNSLKSIFIPNEYLKGIQLG